YSYGTISLVGVLGVRRMEMAGAQREFVGRCSRPAREDRKKPKVTKNARKVMEMCVFLQFFAGFSQ
ncbi:hypothetical protein ACFL1G_11635, partial [Planctomycetota bacterium]